MTHEKLKNCIGQYRELKKDLWWLNRWGVQKIKGYDFGVFYNDFAGHWQFCWNDPENEHRVADVEDIFETEEEAEWHEEFECIERTERLNIPDWQKFKNRDENFGFKVEDYSYKCFTDGRDIEVVEFWGCGARSIFKAPLTKENYTLACRKCKELFLGEDK